MAALRRAAFPEAARRHRGTLSATTHARQRADLARYVIPRIGADALQQLTREHLETLYDELHGRRLVFAMTGARTGEVASLSRSDIDLDAGWLRVRWTLGHVGHEFTRKQRAKSRANERTMALDPATVSALREHRRRQDGARDHAGLIWTCGDGSSIHPKTFYERFLQHSAAAGLPRIRLRRWSLLRQRRTRPGDRLA